MGKGTSDEACESRSLQSVHFQSIAVDSCDLQQTPGKYCSMVESKSALAENHYVLVPGFITPERAAALAADIREAERQGRYTKDAQAPNSPAVGNMLPFIRLLVEKVPQVSEMVGEPVLPTYAYARSYKH